MFSILMSVIIFIVSLIHIAFDRQKRTRVRVAEIFLQYIFFLEVGVEGVLGFLAHLFYPSITASYMGWAQGSQFQLEVAFALLAFGVLGIMSWWIRKDFWVATGIGASLFAMGAAIVRVRDIVLFDNYAPGNAGAVLFNNDIIF